MQCPPNSNLSDRVTYLPVDGLIKELLLREEAQCGCYGFIPPHWPLDVHGLTQGEEFTSEFLFTKLYYMSLDISMNK